MDLVPEELDPDGVVQRRREAVQNPAAHREFPRLRHLPDGAISARRERPEQRLARHDPLRVERDHGTFQDRRTDRAQHRRRDRGDQDDGLAPLEPVEGLHPSRPRLQVGLALGQERDPFAEKEDEVLVERRRDLVAPAEDQKRPARPDLTGGQRQSAGRPVQARENDLRRRREALAEVSELTFVPDELWKHGMRYRRQPLPVRQGRAREARPAW